MRKAAPITLATLLCLSLCACTAPDSGSSSSLQPPVVSSDSSEAGFSAPPASTASDPGFGLSFYMPADDLPPYEPIPISQQHYEGECSVIDFLDLPENDAETLVCDEYYSWVMGEGPRVAALWQPGFSAPPLSNEYSSVNDAYEWIRVDRVQELAAAEVAALSPALLENWHGQYGGSLDYEGYIAAILEAGCRVVMAEYELKYTAEALARMPQLPDGARTEYWLLVPGEDGNLRLFDNTRFFSPLSPPPYEELVPPALDQNNYPPAKPGVFHMRA